MHGKPGLDKLVSSNIFYLTSKKDSLFGNFILFLSVRKNVLLIISIPLEIALNATQVVWSAMGCWQQIA